MLDYKVFMEKIIIEKLRSYYQIPDSISDDDISANCKGSFGESIVRLNIAFDEFKNACANALPRIIKKHLK